MKTEGDYVRIMPKTGENSNPQKVLAPGNIVNPSLIRQRTIENIDNFEWCFEKYVKLRIKVYKDNGFVQRYGESSTRIEDAFEPVIEMYRDRFGIQIILDMQPIYTSHADLCPSRYDEFCVCDDNCNNLSVFWGGSYHHKNVNKMLTQVPDPDTSLYINALFTGHATCYDINGTHSLGGLLGLSNQLYGGFIICNYGSLNDLIKTIAHELGHNYGVSDHYDNDKLLPGQSHDCIWGKNRFNEDIMNNLVVCSFCKDILSKNSRTYIHE